MVMSLRMSAYSHESINNNGGYRDTHQLWKEGEAGEIGHIAE